MKPVQNFNMATTNQATEIITEILEREQPRPRAIIKMRIGWDGPEHTLEEVGKEYGISRERVRQIVLRFRNRLEKHPDMRLVRF